MSDREPPEALRASRQRRCSSSRTLRCLLARSYVCDACGSLLMTPDDGDETGAPCRTTLRDGALVPCPGRMRRATEEDLLGKGAGE